jgi:hypothetical protein
MTKYWAAKCKSCANLGGIRQSKTTGRLIDVVSPSEKFTGTCVHCGVKNEFTGADFVECEASVLETPQTGAGPIDRPGTPSDAKDANRSRTDKE